MARGQAASASGPVIARPGGAPISAAGASMVVHEWTGGGPPWLHVHRSDDEAWHVLEGSLRFSFADGDVDAPAGTTVFVPAGTAHTYAENEPSRYLMFLTPRLDRLIARLHEEDAASMEELLAEFDTYIVEG